MANVELSVQHAAEVASLIQQLGPKSKRAVVGAINDTSKTARTNLARGVSQQIRVPYGTALKAVRLDKATLARPAAHIAMREKYRPGLVTFGARQTKKGVSYKIAKTGKREFIPGAFIAKSNGAERVFKRLGPKRKPVIDLKGPSLNAVITKNDVDASAAKTIETTLPERILARLRLAEQRSR